MAMKKQGAPGNPGGRTSQKISPSVTILGSKIKGFDGLPSGPRKSLTPKQMDEAKALAARLKAREAKAAADKKANAKIIKKDNKTPLVTGRGSTKPVTPLSIGTKKKPVIKVTGRGMGGMRGGGGGGIFGTKNR